MNIIFDLDGTLIDSSESILRSVELAIEECEIEPKCNLSQALIGPPLREMLKVVSGSSSDTLLNRLESSFKNQYDTVGYLETKIYHGVNELISSWAANRHELYIATNKRKVPTEKIIEHLGWKPFFHGCYSLDSFDDVASKAELIKRIIHEHQLKVEECLYIGDTLADAKAAAENYLPCYLVDWGYGDVSAFESRLMRVEDLYAIVN